MDLDILRKGMRCICAAVMECWFQMGAGEEGGYTAGAATDVGRR